MMPPIGWLSALALAIGCASPDIVARQDPAARPAGTPTVAAQAPAAWTDAEVASFLATARVVRTWPTEKGITGSLRATLRDGAVMHDAHIQTVDEWIESWVTAGAIEVNFRDAWQFNVAAYLIDRMLGLNMVPVSIRRRWNNQDVAFTWWVDDVMFDEGERQKRRLGAPDVRAWNDHMQLVRMFDQLIYNIDRNQGNLLVAKGWRIWAIDHTRAFLPRRTLKAPDILVRIDRQVLERLKQLDRVVLNARLRDYLTRDEIDALLKRRDAIVDHFGKLGTDALFDRSQ